MASALAENEKSLGVFASIPSKKLPVHRFLIPSHLKHLPDRVSKKNLFSRQLPTFLADIEEICEVLEHEKRKFAKWTKSENESASDSGIFSNCEWEIYIALL